MCNQHAHSREKKMKWMKNSLENCQKIPLLLTYVCICLLVYFFIKTVCVFSQRVRECLVRCGNKSAFCGSADSWADSLRSFSTRCRPVVTFKLRCESEVALGREQGALHAAAENNWSWSLGCAGEPAKLDAEMFEQSEIVQFTERVGTRVILTWLD